MRFHVAITTCDREQRLRSLIQSIQCLAEKSDHEQETWLYNDGGEIDAPVVTRKRALEGPPHGKRLYWKAIDAIWREARQRIGVWDIFLLVQDDIVLPDDFFDRAARLFKRLNRGTYRFGALNFFGDGPDPKREARWTGAPVTRCRIPEVWSAKWVDLQCVAFHPRALEWMGAIQPVDQDRWIVDPTLSSGVGRQISRRLWRAGMGQYMVREPWVEHVADESKMNTWRNGEVYSS